MQKTIIAVGVFVAATSVAGVFIVRQDSARLRRDLALLRGEVAALTALARNNPSGAAPWDPAVVAAAAPETVAGQDHDEMAKMRRELGGLRESLAQLTDFAETAQAAQALKQSEESVATALTPASALKNAGRATPEASIQTGIWAAAGGEVDALAGTLAFTPSARAKADAWFAGLSETSRQEYGSPEKVIALMISQSAAELTGMQVLGQKAISDTDVGVRVRFASGDDRVKDETFLMRRTGDDWKMVLPDSTVEKFARRLAGGK